MAYFTFNAFAWLVGAIFCYAAAFTLWNLTSRAPSAIAADLRSSLHDGRRFARGFLRLLAGLALSLAALLLNSHAMPIRVPHLFGVVSTATLLAGLLVETILGDDLRRLFAL